MKLSRAKAGLTALSALLIAGGGVLGAAANQVASADEISNFTSPTTTPIKHLVVIYGENVSFDHYFGTYPYAQNLPGETRFTASKSTPSVNGLYNDVANGQPTGPLLTNNLNQLPAGAPLSANANPMRLAPGQAMTCDQDHGYQHEQMAYASGGTGFILNTGHQKTLAQCLTGLSTNGVSEQSGANGANNYAVMDYYDGNTVTGLWNYAQHYAMSDNAYGTNFGPSTDGALNVTSANTYGVICGPTGATINAPACATPAGLNTSNLLASKLDTSGPAGNSANLGAGPGTDVSDADPYYDICSYLPSANGGDNNTAAKTIAMGGPNIGSSLSKANITWGWFEGGFDNGYVPGHGTPPTTAQICSQSHQNVGGSTVTDYIPHHEPFQYYASTANPMHLPPTSVAMIGHNDQANHQYDMADFWAAADSGNMPSVSYLKAPAYQDGHAGYSDPIDEQNFIVSTINHLEQLPTWSSTAVVITYDDSDGWYDHVVSPLVTTSQSSLDALTGTNLCGTSTNGVPLTTTGGQEQGRCGLGPRLPFIVISPYSKSNYVDHNTIDQSSVVKFIESNWNIAPLGDGAADVSAGSINSLFNFDQPSNQRILLNPTTGAIQSIDNHGNDENHYTQAKVAIRKGH
ncbi:MAG: alkaline phosphatase family protein [Actinomycetota bacterium]|nr:alkaline phosphatase family protein [Actinomycetota bacterium]